MVVRAGGVFFVVAPCHPTTFGHERHSSRGANSTSQVFTMAGEGLPLLTIGVHDETPFYRREVPPLGLPILDRLGQFCAAVGLSAMWCWCWLPSLPLCFLFFR